ncbi:PASTA domain-containing protein [Dactylosporangium sp. NPDC049525]|uniref:PASTA domain-containing protein n=1 Tax=Dactylosporangium sp. NPDC049525 TaxID=3154730 RepID=UPI00342E9020
MRHPLRAGLFAIALAAASLAVAPAAHARSTDPAPPVLFVRVPVVQGETLDDAGKLINLSGLKVGAVTGVEDCANLGRVVDQDPDANTLVRRGSAVNLTVGKAPVKGCEIIQ